MKTAILFSALVFISNAAFSQQIGSSTYCSQLADIGANAFNTKKAGHSLNYVLTAIGSMLAHDPQKKRAAEGTVIAIYGDNSIRSATEARQIVYTACKR